KSSAQIEGKPDWLFREFYDVVANSSVPATRDEQRVMMQALLADRFRLVCRRETRELPAFALRAGRKTGISPATTTEKRGITVTPTSVHGEPGFRYEARNVLMAEFADWLWGRFGEAVLDQTGLSAGFDFTFSATADEAMGTHDFINAV